MTYKVVVVESLGVKFIEQLRKHCKVVLIDPLLAEDNIEEFNRTLVSEIEDAHGIIASKIHFTEETIRSARNLFVISSVSAGYNNYPIEALNARGILLCNTPDVLTETTADAAFLLILATARRAIELANFVRNGSWERHINESYFGVDVHGKTLGIIGMGRIGAAIARRGRHGFGMKVIYTLSSTKEALEHELSAEKVQLDKLLEVSDFICITVPLSEDTYHLISKSELEKMSSRTILINIARGEVVDEDALFDCLARGGILGAGLDVFEQEPLSVNSPLINMQQVVAFPHIGSATHETRQAMTQRALDNILLALEGKSPLSSVNENYWKYRK